MTSELIVPQSSGERGEEQDVELAIDRERLRLVWQNIPSSVIGVCGSAIAVVWLLHLDGDPPMLWLWAVAAFGMSLVRLGLYLRFRGVIDRTSKPRRYNQALTVQSTLSALCWAGLPPAFLRVDSPRTYIIVSLIIFGLVVGAVGTIRAYLPSHNSFVAIVVAGTSLKFVAVGGIVGALSLCATTVFIFACIRTALNADRAWVNALRVGMLNETLAARLKEENARVVAAQRLAEEATVAKTRFLAAASHDLRQPLHAQALFITALERTAGAPETLRLAARIKDSHHAMQELLDSLLDISKLDAGVIVPSLRHFAMQPLLDQIRSEFIETARAKGLDLRVVPCAAWVHSDPTLVTRILRNFVSNAIRYTERGRILIGCKRDRGRVRLCVWDTGIGIPAEARQTIFEEFVQLHNPARDRSRGIGLGLAIVRRLAKLINADLTLRSTPGRGSVFAVSLERIAPPTKTLVVESTPKNEDDIALRDKNILVVDDEMMVLEAMHTYLESLGCVAHAACNEAEALEVVAAGTALDAILVDFRLQGNESGLQVIESVRKALGRDLPAVIITGDTAPERIREATAQGHPLLHKPVDTTALARVLTAALRSA